MKLKCAVIVFPGSTGANDIKDACDYYEWKTDLIWHKDCIKNKYDVIFLPHGNPYGTSNYTKEYIVDVSNSMREIPYSKTLIVGFSDGFQILCRMNLLKGHLEQNNCNEIVTGFIDFYFLYNEVFLTISTL